MTNFEALKIIENKKNILWNHPDLLEAFNVVNETLRKQIPKKILPENNFFAVGKCPSCKAIFFEKTFNYCGNCGQALDWSEPR